MFEHLSAQVAKQSSQKDSTLLGPQGDLIASGLCSMVSGFSVARLVVLVLFCSCVSASEPDLKTPTNLLGSRRLLLIVPDPKLSEFVFRL